MVNRLHYPIAQERAAEVERAGRRARLAAAHAASRSESLHRRALMAVRELRRAKREAPSRAQRAAASS
jgi:hypothetical protein